MFRHPWLLLALFLAFLFPAPCRLQAKEPPELSTNQDKPVRILFVTESAGFKHGSVKRKVYQLSPAERAMTELGLTSGMFRVDVTQDCARDFTKENLAQYNIVMFYTTGDLPIPKETLDYFVNDWLQQPGHGFLGVHSATDTYLNNKLFYEMLGGTFESHPWNSNSTVSVNVHDPKHPAMKPWGEAFEIQDEIYQFKHWQPEKVRVLMSLDMGKTKLKKPYHVPIAWCREFGKGRVFYISLGHREELWTNPKYLDSLSGAIAWLLGKEPADATPNPELSAEQDKLAKESAQSAKQ